MLYPVSNSFRRGHFRESWTAITNTKTVLFILLKGPLHKGEKKWVGQWYQNKSWSVEAPIPLAIWSFDLDPCRYRWEIHWSVFQSLDWFKGNVTGKPWKTLYFMVSGSDFPANPLISIDPMLPSCSHSVGSWLDLSREALPLETVAIHLKNEWLNHVNTTKWGGVTQWVVQKELGSFPWTIEMVNRHLFS